MDEIALSQAVKEALLALAQELGQSYQLPAYLKSLDGGEVTVVFKLFKGKVQITAPVTVTPKIEEVVQIVEQPSITPAEPTETPPEKHKRKRKSEV